jgi:hypothetical protein
MFTYVNIKVARNSSIEHKKLNIDHQFSYAFLKRGGQVKNLESDVKFFEHLADETDKKKRHSTWVSQLFLVVRYI